MKNISETVNYKGISDTELIGMGDHNEAFSKMYLQFVLRLDFLTITEYHQNE